MKIRMKDIAEMANVSETTVSLVLNDKKTRISEKKKREIKDLAEKYNYIPNMAAKGLASKKTNTIGLIIPDLENPFFSTLAKVIETELRQKGFYTILVNSDDKLKNEVSLIDKLINMGVDGLLITLSNEAFVNKKETIERMNRISVPYVLLDRNITELECSQVYFNNYRGGEIATQYLLDLGHTNIGFLKAPSYIENAKDRFLGYLDTMEKNGIKVCENWIASGNFKFEGGYNASNFLLENETITAIIVANDLMLFGLLKRASELNKKVPKDYSLIGYDHSKYIEMSVHPSTTIKQSGLDMGEKACQLISEQINGFNNKVIILEPSLVVGETTKKI